MKILITWLCLTGVAHAQQALPPQSAPKQVVRPDYTGPLLYKTVNGLGEGDTIPTPSSRCQVSKDSVLKVNASLENDEMKIVQRSYWVNKPNSRSAMKSIDIDFEKLQNKIDEAGEAELQQGKAPEGLTDRPSYRAVAYNGKEWVYVTLYRVADTFVFRESKAVDELIAQIDAICDNDKSFKELVIME